MIKPVAATLLLVLSAGSTQAAPLSLQEALSKRAAVSRSLKMAALDEQIAEDGIVINRSGYLPRLDISGGYTAQQAPQAISVPQGSFETQQADYGFFSASLTQTLYDFGRTGSRYERALLLSETRRFAYKSLEQDLFLATVAAYFRILQTERLLASSEEEVKQMTDHLRVARDLYEQGVVTRNDLLQAEVRLASSRQRRLETANRLTNAWLELNDQIGEPPGYRGELADDTRVDLAEPDIPAEKAVSLRSELKARHSLLSAADAEVGEMRSGYFPELYAKMGIDYVENDRVKEQAIMAATVGLKINLFDGLATTSRYRQAVKNRARAEEELHKLKSDLLLEYRTAVNDAKVAKERIAVTETSIRQGEENLRINRDRYQEQVGTATDVIDAQTLLSQIRNEHFQALFDYQVALARLKRAREAL